MLTTFASVLASHQRVRWCERLESSTFQSANAIFCIAHTIKHGAHPCLV